MSAGSWFPSRTGTPKRPWLDWLSPLSRLRLGAPVRLETGHAQDRGDRGEQQDRIGVWRGDPSGSSLAVVADGLGGLSDGAAAAACAVTTFGRAWRAPPVDPSTAAAWLEATCHAAHRAIRAHQRTTGGVSGSTVAAVCLTPEWAVWCHVGDTRVYLVRNGRVIRRTRDHSLAAALELTDVEAGTRPERNQLTQCLGGGAPIHPVTDHARLAVGDGLLVASDGVWAQLPEAALLGGLSDGDLVGAARRLVFRAVRAAGGASDNASVFLARTGR